ncbi:Toll-like receptor 6 [Armadillidium nasatum]|uniref:Toll-like receptor 6 n=1 Tax=Armadillidium nasatum TaxID=96803 RepID=A0A5N5T2L2_9CRUS|nr:Toll-like receptor 6 [Armadillidium nasatum]
MYIHVRNNSLTVLAPGLFRGLEYLVKLDLSYNELQSEWLTEFSFQDLIRLVVLDLSHNKISQLNQQAKAFDGVDVLSFLALDNNQIKNIEKAAFSNLKSLEDLNINGNKLREVPEAISHLRYLKALDLGDNLISSLRNLPVNGLDLLYGLRLVNNKISGNISRDTFVNIPSLKILNLAKNDITHIDSGTFTGNRNLQAVRLDANSITSISNLFDSLPNLGVVKCGNSFICDCDMEWLQRINNLKHDRCYPTIMDLDSIYCQMPFIRGGVYLPLVDIQPSQFLCQYVSHCFTLCHCCEFDACDCEMSCPDGCRCYHDQSWRSNIVNCSAYDLVAVPDRIPMDATEVYLDGNDFKNLSSHSFIGRKHMQILYVNASNVNTLDNETFSGLTRLTVLHLEDNLLETLRGHEFKYLSPLRELYLHNNKLRYIHQHTFVDMSHLEILTLHDNRLINFPVWRMVDNPYLMKISLRNNLWTCECQFVESFEIWVMDNVRKVIDSDELKCISTSDESPDSYIIDFNATNCLNSSSTSTVIQPMIFHNLLHPVIAIVVAFIVLVLLLILLFLSSKDEVWVNQILAAQLERGEKPYRVCLHYRDFPVTAYITETMVEAVESSKRTIIVLSKNFIENEWCRFQFKSAHHEVLKKKRKKIIVVVLGDIPSRDLDADLKLYLKTNTCIRKYG